MQLMKPVVLLACLLGPAAFLPLLAETPAPAPAQEAAAPLSTRLRTLLDGMERAQSEDFYEAAKLVLEETQNAAAFYPLMEEASRAGSAAATAWLVPLELHRLQLAGADLASDPRAVELCTRAVAAAKKGYRPASFLAFRLMDLGVGGPEDAAAARRYLVEGSKVGCTQSRAAFLLVSGRLQGGEAKDPAVAAELKRNNYHLEEMLAQVHGDSAEGVKWLRLASSHGSAAAPFLLTQSQTAALPEREAMEMLELAASRHHVPAMAFLANIKLNARELNATSGSSLVEDTEGGLLLLRHAAALGDAEAAQSLASTLAQGTLGAVPVEQVCELYRLAAEQGSAEGMAGYGYCLMAGRGFTADAALGEEWLLRAVDKGALWANQALASAWYNGFGVKPDLRRAVNALGEDAAMGSVHAYAIMAGITALGNEGTAPDPMRARIYLDMAKQDGDTEAQAIYDAILKAGGWRFLPALW